MPSNINEKLEEISIKKLGVPAWNLRKHNTELELDDLAINIHAVGQSQPILVYKKSDGSEDYEVLEGQRRLNAFDQLNQKYPNKGYDKILAAVTDEPETANKKRAISLGANITQLPMTVDDIQKGVQDLWKDLSNMTLVAEQFGISEKTAKKYVKGARLDDRLNDATTSGEICDDPEQALDHIMEAVDVLGWKKGSKKISDEKVLQAAKTFEEKTRAEVVEIIGELEKDPEQDIDVVIKDIEDKPKERKPKKRTLVLSPDDDDNLTKYAKTTGKKPEIAAAQVLIKSLKHLVPQTDED